MPSASNRLAHERSPYLLQHAHNPVDWYPWGDEAFAKARAEDKLVLVSIGYSSCHWCHVMERESFEDPEVAQVMNARFVCIKVDREERPDVDHVYMEAVQLLTGRGGWPLNCFALPDGRPVHGGTYVPKAQWVQLLERLDHLWQHDRTKVLEHATAVHKGLRENAWITPEEALPDPRLRDLTLLVDGLKERFDRVDGGSEGAPKFPLPSNLLFLLKEGVLRNDDEALAHVRLTLDRMAWGGLFDQVGGGFARYSVDAHWHVPHFEKMLYDNAQLITLYAKAYQAFGDAGYRDVAERTIAFVQRELMLADGGFCCALDADSEGEEGLFYTWTKAELAGVLGNDLAFAEAYYGIGTRGPWEHGRYILMRTGSDTDFAQAHGLSPADVHERTTRVNARLLAARAQRTRPGLDHKVLTGWNALMVRALCDAYEALTSPELLQAAERAMRLICAEARRSDGGLWRSRTDGVAAINGQLEDHAHAIDAALALYGVTFNETWLDEARALLAYTEAHFLDRSTGLFRSTSDLDPALVTTPVEVLDSVMPSPNAVMASVLFTLGHLDDRPERIAHAARLLDTVRPRMGQWPSGHTHWAQVMQAFVHPYPEIAITGPGALEKRLAFAPHYIPQCLFIGTTTDSTLPLLAGKSNGTTRLFVCKDRTCSAPVSEVHEALRSL